MTLMHVDGDPWQQGRFSWHLHRQQILTAGLREKKQGGPEILSLQILTD